MKVSELIERLSSLKKDALVCCSSDEELNTVYSEINVALFEGDDKIVIWGNSGSEI